jgi:hypothetical protein
VLLYPEQWTRIPWLDRGSGKIETLMCCTATVTLRGRRNAVGSAIAVDTNHDGSGRLFSVSRGLHTEAKNRTLG